MPRKIRHARAAFFELEFGFWRSAEPFFDDTCASPLSSALELGLENSNTVSITVLEQYSTQGGVQKAEFASPQATNWTANEI